MKLKDETVGPGLPVYDRKVQPFRTKEQFQQVADSEVLGACFKCIH